jgi:predicted RND superfamily exporter protein/CRP-like cAMP-binding protein
MKAVHAQTEHLAGAAPFNIIIETDRPDVFKHPAMLKRLEALQDWAVREVDGIDTTISIVDYIKLLNKAIHQNDQDYYKIPDTAQEVGLLFFIYSTSGSSKDLAPFITPDYSTVNVLVRSRLVGSTKTNQAIQRIEGKARELFKRPEFKPTGGGNIMAPLLVSRQEEEGVEKAEQLEDDSDIEVLDWNAGPADEEPDSSSIEGTEEGVEEIPWDEEESEMEELDWGDEDEDNLGDDVEVLPWGEDDEETGAAAGQTQGAEGKDISQPDKTIAMSLPAPSEKEFPWPQVDVHMTGTIYLMNKSAVAISKSQITGLVTALAAIFLVMSLLFLSTKIGLMAMLPNIFPIFILFGLMGFSGITLNFSTSLIAAIALGIGVDDTIQYINRYNMEVNKSRDQTRAMVAALKSMGRPMIYTSVALFFGFIILTLSDFVPIRQFGMLTAITIIVALLSNLLILPGLMITVRIITLWDLINLEVGENPSQYIKIFHGLSNHQARVAILMGHVEDYKDGDLIIREGDMGREMYVVLKGQVDIFRGEGDKEVFIFTINPGDTFGEMALLRQSERSASARARGEVKLFVVDEQTLHRLEKRYSRISSKIFYNITLLLSDRLQTTTDQLVYSADNQQ